MRLFLCVLINFFVILYVLLPIAYSFNIPADSNEIYDTLSDLNSNAKQPVSQASSTDSGGHNQIVGLKESTGAPIQLIKEISPDGNYSHLVDTALRVRVEVLITGKELKYIQILESIDPSLKVFNISKVYIINNLLELPKIDNGFEHPENVDKLTKGIVAFTTLTNKKYFNNITKEFDNDTLYSNKYKLKNDDAEYSSIYTNNTLFIEKRNDLDSEKVGSDNIGKKGRIVYWYDIMSNESGIYDIRTTVRTNDEYHDVDQITKIDFREHDPQFEVLISGKKTELDCGEISNISYNVKYVGGSMEPYTCDLSISNASNDYEIADGPSSYLNESFQLNEIKHKYFNVKYLKEGKFYLPDLSIYSECMVKKPNLYTFRGEVIEVVGTLKRYNDLITWIVLGLGIIIAQIYGKDLNTTTKSFFEILRGIRLFDALIANFKNKYSNPAIKYLKKKLKYENKKQRLDFGRR
jgi:hypothetical protein